jgi:hypothetical protein
MSSLGHIALSIIRTQLVYRDGVPLALLGANRAMVAPGYVSSPIFYCIYSNQLKQSNWILFVPWFLERLQLL